MTDHVDGAAPDPVEAALESLVRVEPETLSRSFGTAAEATTATMRVGAADDPEEREADQMADRVQRILSGGAPSAVVERPTRIVRSGAIARSTIRRSRSDGKPNKLPRHFGAKNFKAATSVKGAKRGESLSTIDKWLAQANAASTYDEQQYALKQLADACEHWLTKHATKGKRSVEKRRPTVSALKSVANMAYVGDVEKGGGATSTPSSPDKGDNVLDVAEGLLDAVADSAGITGDYADINLDVTSPDSFDASQHGAMSQGGGGSINDSTADIFEGANMVGGLIGMGRGFKDLANKDNDSWEDAEAAGNTLASTGKMIHGAYKLTKGIALNEDGDSTEWTQVGDIGAAAADGLGAVADFISWMKTIRDSRKKSKEQGGLTGKEKFDTAADLTEGGLNVVHKGTKTALDITKAATEVGATNAIVGLSTAAGAVGLVIATIETARGILQVKRGYDASKKIDETRAEQEAIIADVAQRVEAAKQATRQFVAGDANAPNFDEEFNTLIDDWGDLQAAYGGVVQIQKESEAAMDAMQKLQSRQMEQGAVKAAQGTVNIISGALLLSGVGAPIAIGVAAIAGIIALSYAGVKLARNASATGLIALAQRMTDDGVPTGKPDATPSYRDMELRVNAAYYNNMVSVIKGKAPFGFDDGEFGSVKQFVWDEKFSKKIAQTTVLDGFGEVAGVASKVMHDTWLEVHNGDTIKREKPTGKAKVGRKVKPSAHKSSQAMEANKEDIAIALLNLARGSFVKETGQFKEVPINPVGDTDLVENMQLVTIHGLLGAADINSKRWAAWLEQADDEAAMKKLIIGHLK